MFATLRSRSAQLGPWPRRLAALACLVLAVATFTTREAEPHAAVVAHTQLVVVAAHDLPVGHRLTARDLERRRWPTPLIPEATSTRPVQLIGKLLASPVAQGEVMSPRRVVGRDLTAGLGPGQVAAVVAVDGSNTAALIRPGDRVDVLGSPQPVDSGGLPTASGAAGSGRAGSGTAEPDPSISSVAGSDAGGRGGAPAVAVATGPVLLAANTRVLAVLTSSGDFGEAVDVVVAADRPAAMRLVRASSSQMFTLLPRAP